MMAVLLRQDGFETDVAADGEEALDKARSHPPNIIVLDMKLPPMDGWTFRAHQRYDRVLASVVLLTPCRLPG
jgi:DNA-binding response OmpR family regulator